MRIVSMLPGATEIAYALGLGERVVGVSHECDFPPEARGTRVVTRSTLPMEGASSGEIDRLVSAAVAQGSELYHADPVALRELAPDLVLTQGLCDVCAVSVRDARASLGNEPRVLSLDASGLEGIFRDIERVAEAAGAPDRGSAVVAALRERIEAVRRSVAGLPERRVVCLEWADPPFSAGHWAPEMVGLAGGRELLAAPGERSRRLAWREVVEAAPDVIVLMPCGFDTERALGELPLLERLPGWEELPAVRAGAVWAVDGNAYFSRPGPRLADGVALLARVLHWDTLGAPDFAAARRVLVGVSDRAR